MKNSQNKYSGMTKRAARSPLAAIRLKCLDCVCGQVKEVALCPVKECSIWPFRFGKLPDTARKLGKNVCVVT